MLFKTHDFIGLSFALVTILAPTLVVKAEAQKAALATSVKEQNKLDSLSGFRAYKFGAALSEFQGLRLEKDQGGLKLYAKKDENLQFGPIKLEGIVYHFFQGKFFAVSLHTEDRENTLGLLRIAQAAFGTGTERPNLKDDLDRTWLGKNAEAFFTINPKTEQGSLLIRDSQLASQVETYSDRLTQKAADDL